MLQEKNEGYMFRIFLSLCIYGILGGLAGRKKMHCQAKAKLIIVGKTVFAQKNAVKESILEQSLK